jgi:BMFP domain-containing protein YqiC
MKHGNFIDDLSKCLGDAVKRVQHAMPTGVREAQKDLEKNFHGILQNAFAKLDLITREEFDIQANVLARTRRKLETLEKHVAELENKRRPVTNRAVKDKKTK